MNLLLFCAALAVSGADAPAPAAMVLTSGGNVTLERGAGPPQRLGAMTLLRPGDRLRAVAGATATLVALGDGHRERLKPGAEATVAEKGCTPAEAVERLPGPKLSPANLKTLHEMARSARAGVSAFRRDDPEAAAQAVTPMYGAAVLTDRPALSWAAAAKADGYLVQLFSGGEGREQRLLWKAATQETRLPYPDREKPLKYGLNYRWRVRPLHGEEQGEPIANSKFAVLTRAEVAALAELKELADGTAAEDWLLAAALYEAHDVYDEALRLYERLAAKMPQEANFQTALASYYERAGRADRASEARTRARKLGAVLPEP